MTATPIDPSELAPITNLLRQGDLVAAEAACRELLSRAPRDAAAIHVLGLIRREAGDTAAGERLLRESIDLAPREPWYRSNLAQLLRRLRRHREAEALYREALQIDANHAPARAGLVRTLSDLGQSALAEQECRKQLASNDRDPQLWSLLGAMLREQLRLPEAEAAYRRALALAPDHRQAQQNLGPILVRLDRAEEALQALDRAESLGMGGFDVAFNRGMALTQLCRLDEAERSLERAIELDPLHGEAQVNLARLRFMRGDRDFARGIAAAAAQHRQNAHLQILLSLLLRRAGDLPRAEALLRDVLRAEGPLPDIRAALAEVLLESGRLKEAETEALEAATSRPDDARITDILVMVLLSRGRAQDAMPFIRRQRERNPLGQGWIAYEATAARLLGDPLYHELYDFDRFVRAYDLEAPAGWASMQALNDAVLRALNERHPFANHPLDRSARHGSHTARNLITDPDPAIRSLLRIFAIPIDDYRREMGTSATHPLASRNVGAAEIIEAWSVQLRRQGFHVNHVHADGWISSAYYVSVPEEVQDETLKYGWLKFGEPRYPVPGAGPEGVVEPRAGRLVLFPSYMWHGTNPIHGTQPRTAISFDAVPKKAPMKT